MTTFARRDSVFEQVTISDSSLGCKGRAGQRRKRSMTIVDRINLATELALAAAAFHEGCDTEPSVDSVTADRDHVDIDVTYSTRGDRALYTLIDVGKFILARS